MADNGSAQSASTQAWPLPSFYFKVSISNVGDTFRAARYPDWKLSTML